MKLVSTSCPNCSAQLNIDADIKQAKCEYCGFTFLIDDEIRQVNHTIKNASQAGYEFESGRLRAIQEAKENEKRKQLEQLQREQQFKAEEQRQIEELNKKEQLRRDTAETRKLALIVMGVGAASSIMIPYILPIALTAGIIVYPTINTKIKIVTIGLIWVIAAAIIGIRLV